MKVLCDKAGIDCVLVDGHAIDEPDSAGEAHMWNYVKIDGTWYAVDATWNDPVVDGASGKESGYESEKYLLVGSNTTIEEQTFINSHPVENSIGYSCVPHFTNGPEISENAFEDENLE